MMALLVPDVSHDPGQVLLAEAYDPLAGLPLECPGVGGHAVDVMAGAAFHLAYPVADLDRWRDADGHMNVIGGAADSVHPHALRCRRPGSDEFMHSGFHGRFDELAAFLGVPREVQEYLTVDISRHGGSPVRQPRIPTRPVEVTVLFTRGRNLDLGRRPPLVSGMIGCGGHSVKGTGMMAGGERGGRHNAFWETSRRLKPTLGSPFQGLSV